MIKMACLNFGWVQLFQACTDSGKSCTRGYMANNGALRFPDWEMALSRVTEGREQILYKRAILGFLHLCKVSRAPATIMLAKEYIEQLEKQGNKRDETTREALHWFVKTARSPLDALAR